VSWQHHQRSVAGQNLLRHEKGYGREASDFLWDTEREFSTRLGEESVDIYLAWKDQHSELHPIVTTGDFRWEMSRLPVRLSWWKKMSSKFQLLNDEELELFRTKQHRPMGQVILVSEAGESPYYNKRIGLIGS
ncbi:CRISPR-associated helicase/endonuclease Cas3, partial [Escherichia coli]|nr:CRISPR-associated helicase/endonuclease Cas3 [Escherichia coli]